MRELLFNYVLVFMMITFSFLAICNLYPNKKIERKNFILSLTIVFLCSILFGMAYKLFVPLFCILGATGLLYMTGRRLFISIVCSIIGLFVMFSSELVVTKLMGALFMNSKEVFATQTNSFIATIILGTTGYAVTRILGKYIHKMVDVKKINDIGLIDKILSAVLLLYSVLLLILNINFLLTKGNDAQEVFIFSLLFLAYILLIAVILYRVARNVRLGMEVSYKTKELEQKETLLKNLKDYSGELEYLYENMRDFRHDYVNILSSMYSYIEEKEWDKLETYFKEKILPIGREMDRNKYKLGLLKNLKIMEVKGLLSMKVIYAQEKNVDFAIDIAEEIHHIQMDVLDLCKSVGILLDNAIEAALESEEKYVRCGIVKKNETVLIIICNSYGGEGIDIRRIFEKGFTTKANENGERGIGLYALSKMVNAYSNVELETDIAAQEFKIILKISNGLA